MDETDVWNEWRTERRAFIILDLELANLQGADLLDVKNLTQEQLDKACGDEWTTLPNELTIKKCPDWRTIPEKPADAWPLEF